MKRVLVVLVALAGCAHDPAEIQAYCQRWSARLVSLGAHENPAAYQHDLMTTCMAMKGTPYDAHELPPVTSATGWVNASVSEADYTRTLGRDKANCIERGYVGQASQGASSGEVSGSGNVYGSSVSGRNRGSYNSVPAFDGALFMACMNAVGWELPEPAR
jgi:hypothetical protein